MTNPFRTHFLKAEEFNKDFFDGYLTGNQHPGGYWHYDQAYTDLDWEQIANIFLMHGLSGSVLEIGCAKGKLVKELHRRGLEAYGLDISDYAVRTGEPWIEVGDARNLSRFSEGQFDFIISHQFFTMLSEEDVRKAVDEMNRVAKKQIHIIQEAPDTRFNISHPISWWGSLGFRKAVLIGEENNQNIA